MINLTQSRCVCLAGVLLFCISNSSIADDSSPNELQGWSLFIENDLFYLIDNGKNEDRNYSIGINVGLHGEAASQTWLNDGLSTLDSFFAPDKRLNTGHFQHSTHLGVAVFTPDDLANPNPIHDDRPYASLLYWSNRSSRISQDGKSGLSTELIVGVLGLDIAGYAQKVTHKFQREISDSDTPVEPKGWDHQISDGGELTFRYGIDYKRLILNSSWSDLSYSIGANIGYNTDVSTGLLWRIGQRSSHFSAFDANPVMGSSYIGSQKSGGDHFIYFSYKVTGVAYNELLQGGFRNSTVTFDSNQIERAVQSFGIGWTMTLDSGTRLTLAQYMQTPEFKGPNARKHYWGGFYLTFPFAKAR